MSKSKKKSDRICIIVGVIGALLAPALIFLALYFLVKYFGVVLAIFLAVLWLGSALSEGANV